MDITEVIQQHRPQRITAAQAANVVDIVCVIQMAFREGHYVEITSDFPRLEPMDWPK